MSNIVSQLIQNKQERELILQINKMFGVENTAGEINDKIADILLDLQNHKNKVIEDEKAIGMTIDSLGELEDKITQAIGLTNTNFYRGSNGIVGVTGMQTEYIPTKRIYQLSGINGSSTNIKTENINQIDTATEIKKLKNGLIAASHFRGGMDDPVNSYEYTLYQHNGNKVAISFDEYNKL